MPARPINPLHDLDGPPMILNPYAFAPGGGGGFAPTDIAGCVIWLSDTGASAGTWPDLSGNGNDATQATGSAQPSIQAGVLNGHQSRRFDGVNDIMDCPAETIGMVFIVMIPYGTESYGSMLSTGTPRRIIIRDGTSNNMYFDGNSLVASPAMRKNAALSTTLGTTAAYFTGPFSAGPSSEPLRLGADLNGGTYASGDILEVIAYDTVLGSTDRDTVEAYLAAKYAL